MSVLNVKKKDECRYDCISLGEVMLRLDPGEGRIKNARSFRVWEGGGEYNVSRGLKNASGWMLLLLPPLPIMRWAG